jgi:hypothetical protein
MPQRAFLYRLPPLALASVGQASGVIRRYATIAPDRGAANEENGEPHGPIGRRAAGLNP